MGLKFPQGKDDRVQYLTGLLKEATLYHLERLRSLIAAALLQPSPLMTPNNVLDIRGHAQAVSQNDLVTGCTKYIRNNRTFLEKCIREQIQSFEEERANIQRPREEDVLELDDGLDDSEDEDCADPEEVEDEDETKAEAAPDQLEKLEELNRKILKYRGHLQELKSMSI